MEALSVGIGAWATLEGVTSTEVISLSKRSLYCRAPAGLVCVGSQSIGRGPINVLLSEHEWNALYKRILVGEHLAFSIGPTSGIDTVLLMRRCIYAVRIDSPCDFGLKPVSLDFLWSLLFTYGKGPMLCAFNGRASSASDPIDKVVIQRGKQGIDLLRISWNRDEWQFIADVAVKTLLGLGPGLTPSGDDLLVGYMSGLDLISTISSRAREIKKMMQSNVLSSLARTNEISQTHFRWACRGYYMEPLTALLKAIAGGDPEAVGNNMKELLARGASSGTDTAIGLLLALENGKEMESSGYSLAN
ncbi:hypothetical protein MOOTH_19700 [Moorella thermoacetica]|nr:hypothetical protein MOOTH_19700 [Moorella thermoacetica]